MSSFLAFLHTFPFNTIPLDLVKFNVLSAVGHRVEWCWIMLIQLFLFLVLRSEKKMLSSSGYPIQRLTARLYSTLLDVVEFIWLRSNRHHTWETPICVPLHLIADIITETPPPPPLPIHPLKTAVVHSVLQCSLSLPFLTFSLFSFVLQPWEPQCIFEDFRTKIFCGDSWGKMVSLW